MSVRRRCGDSPSGSGPFSLRPVRRRRSSRKYRSPVAERVLTLKELNRATLARQLLLERRRTGVVPAIERLAGLQAQWPPSPYIGLWSRLEGFKRDALERAVRAGQVVKPTVMRGTLHLITSRDYPLFWWALTDMPTWYDATHLAHAESSLARMRTLAE